MIEKIIYRNHMNEEISFGQSGIFVNSNELHDFEWAYTSKNDKISSFTKGIVKKTVPVVIQCDSEEEGVLIKNKLFEIAEKDVLTMQHGKIIIGDYYMKCFVTGSKKSDYLFGKNHMKSSLTITTDYPYWVKETTTVFGYGEGSEGTNLDFNNDFPMDYSSNVYRTKLNNSNLSDTNFKMVIYGACENPSVTISGHEYEVLVSLGTNEYLTIDSAEKKITLTHADGTTENCFNKRNRDSYIFQKIQPGMNNVAKGVFRFDVTLLEERGEPKWT